MKISPDSDREGCVANLQLSLEGVFTGRMNTLHLIQGLVSDEPKLLERSGHTLAINRDGGGSASITVTDTLSKEVVGVYKIECIDNLLDTLLNKGKAVTLHRTIL